MPYNKKVIEPNMPWRSKSSSFHIIKAEHFKIGSHV